MARHGSRINDDVAFRITAQPHEPLIITEPVLAPLHRDDQLEEPLAHLYSVHAYWSEANIADCRRPGNLPGQTRRRASAHTYPANRPAEPSHRAGATTRCDTDSRGAGFCGVSPSLYSPDRTRTFDSHDDARNSVG